MGTDFRAAAWNTYSTPSSANLSLSMSLTSPTKSRSLSSLSSSRSLSWSCHLRLIPTRREILYSGFSSSLDSAVPRLPVMPVIATEAPRQKMFCIDTRLSDIVHNFQGKTANGEWRRWLACFSPVTMGLRRSRTIPQWMRCNKPFTITPTFYKEVSSITVSDKFLNNLPCRHNVCTWRPQFCLVLVVRFRDYNPSYPLTIPKTIPSFSKRTSHPKINVLPLHDTLCHECIHLAASGHRVNLLRS